MRIVPAKREGLLIAALLAAIALPCACGRKAVMERPDVARITVEEVAERLEAGEAITFVDSRSAGSWGTAVGKIPGAVRVPPDDIATHISGIPRGNPVVVYCT